LFFALLLPNPSSQSREISFDGWGYIQGEPDFGHSSDGVVLNLQIPWSLYLAWVPTNKILSAF